MDATKINYEKLEFFDDVVLYTGGRVDRNTVPDGWYAYDLRHDDDGNIIGVAPHITVNHWGTIITNNPIECEDERQVTPDDYGYIGDEVTLSEFMKEVS